MFELSKSLSGDIARQKVLPVGHLNGSGTPKKWEKNALKSSLASIRLYTLNHMCDSLCVCAVQCTVYISLEACNPFSNKTTSSGNKF